jgi:uncharacterized protein (TIGR03086 family)
MSEAVDLEPAAQRVARVVAAVPPHALDRPTPCADYCVGDLLDHLATATLGLARAAAKVPGDNPPAGDARNLAEDWQSRLPRDAVGLAVAWQAPDAWTGMTGAGGLQLPGDVVGMVALGELVVHGWDLAKATGQPAGYDGPGLDAFHEAVLGFRASGADGIFGPIHAVADDAPLFERILGLTGRDPHWTPPR